MPISLVTFAQKYRFVLGVFISTCILIPHLAHAGTIEFITPGVGQEFEPEQEVHIRWKNPGLSRVDIGFMRCFDDARTNCIREEVFSAKTTSPYNTEEEYYWSIPVSFIPSTRYAVTLTNGYNPAQPTESYSGESVFFTIQTDDRPVARLGDIIFPQEQTVLSADAKYTFVWDQLAVDRVDLFLRRTIDGVVVPITMNQFVNRLASPASYTWIVPKNIIAGAHTFHIKAYGYEELVGEVSVAVVVESDNAYVPPAPIEPKEDTPPSPEPLPSIEGNSSAAQNENTPLISPELEVIHTRVASGGYQLSEWEKSVTTREAARFGATNEALRGRLRGKLLLQVEEHGEVWYVDTVTGLRFYLKDGSSAYAALRAFGLGITTADLEKIPVGTLDASDMEKSSTIIPLAQRLEGKIVLQVQAHGEAWYILSGKRYYLKNGDAAYQVMRHHSLGITNANLNTLPLGTLR